VLDPEQNASFLDNYLGVPFDLSKVMFLGTANLLDGIPPALRDRMEIIPLPGYSQEEKLEIARRYLIPRQRLANGVDSSHGELSDALVSALIGGYTREAGVRQLEREIGAVLRHQAVRLAEGQALGPALGVPDLDNILGPPLYENEVAMRTCVPGVATGLAWTPAGGDILFIEATRVPGSGKLLLTGQLGEVMKESAQAALSAAKAQLEPLGLPVDLLEHSDLHIHVPAGATPKDGPSAGVAIYVALISLFTGRALRPDVAMTGEISLRGLVLPVGGIKEKVLAAKRAGMKEIILCWQNEKDVQEIETGFIEGITFHYVKTMQQVLELALS